MSVSPPRLIIHFLVTCYCGFTFALAVSPWIALGVTFVPLHIWEIVVLIIGILNESCLAIKIFTSNGDETNTTYDDVWYKRCQLGFVLLSGIPSLAFYIYSCSQVLNIFNTSCEEMILESEARKIHLEAARDVFLAVFCFFQLVIICILQLRKYNNTSITTVNVALVLAANAILGLEVYLNVMKEAKTRELKNENLGNIPFSDIQFSNVKCSSNGTYVITDYVSEKVYRFTYTCPFEFALLSICIVLDAWKPQLQRENQRSIQGLPETDNSTEASADGEDQSNSRDKKGSYSECFCSIHVTGALCVIVFLCLIVRIFLDGERNEDLIVKNLPEIHDYSRARDISKLITWVQLFLSVVYFTAAVFGFRFLLSKNKDEEFCLNVEFKLLVFGAVGLLLLNFFRIIDFIGDMTERGTDYVGVFYFLKSLGQLFTVYAQTLLIMSFCAMSVGVMDMRIKNIILFFGCSNLANWVSDKFLNPSGLVYLTQKKTSLYGLTSWWLITELLFPVVIIGRLQAAMLCFKGICRFKRLSKFSSTFAVTPRSYYATNNT